MCFSQYDTAGMERVRYQVMPGMKHYAVSFEFSQPIVKKVKVQIAIQITILPSSYEKCRDAYSHMRPNSKQD